MTDGGGQELGQTWAPLAEVAAAYGVSIDTIRRRMKRGELEARRHQTPQGFKWLALMPETIEPAASEPPHDAPRSLQPSDVSTQGVQIVERDREELVATLRQELALRNREIARLHEVIASQAKAIEVTMAALPANVQTVEQPAPPPATKVSGAPDDAIETPGSFWARVRGWFSG
jgi:hypothetical protein